MHKINAGCGGAHLSPSIHLSSLSLSDIKFATVIVLKEGFAMCVALAGLVGTHSNPTASAS